MLLTRQSREAKKPELNIAAMIDIVFLLLIFFMCTSSFKSVENELQSQTSQPGSGATEEEQDFPPVRVEVSVAGAGVLFECDNQACAGFSDLVGKLKSRTKRRKDLVVIISGQGAVPFGQMAAALKACYMAGVESPAFSTKGIE